MIIIDVKLVDEATKKVTEHRIHFLESSYGWEVVNYFEKLGNAYAKVIDPQHDTGRD